MALTAQTVLLNAIIILQDAGSVRWPLSELRKWLNAGLKEVSRIKPSATAATTTIELVAGTKQSLPATASLLLRAIRNVDGPVLTPIAREILDAQIPNWHKTTTVPYAAIARHIIQDPVDTRTFYVFPGNDGNGEIEVVLSNKPTEVAAPADEFDIELYTAELGLEDLYENALVDYILYRAFSKDMQMAGAGDRALAHYKAFKEALGERQAIEGVANVNTTQSQPNS